MSKKHKLFTLILGLLMAAAQVSGQVQLTNIPTIYIKTLTPNADISKSYWLPATITVVGGDSSDVRKNDTIEIKGRGNSTWGLAKKPYRIKFNQKRHLLNMNDDAKDWVLLANYADKTLIRNAVAFEIGRFFGMAFTPSVRFADLYINNVFLGNYFITDQIEAGKNRVNIERISTVDVKDTSVTGGYLFERDGFNTGEAVYFFSNKSVPFSVKEPDSDSIQEAQKTYLTNFVNAFESNLFAANWKDPLTGYRSKLDTTSFLKWYIASELTGNIDCFWSTYMYKHRNDSKLYYGPLWDYDIAFDNDTRRRNHAKVRMIDPNSNNGAFGDRTWITQVSTDPWFKLSVNALWKKLVAKDLKNHLQTYVDSLVNLLGPSVKKNYEKWNTLNTIVYNEWYQYPTYQEYVNVLKNYLNTRVDFLTTSFEADASTVTLPTSPFKLEPYYYAVTNKSSMTLMDVYSQALADSSRSVLYSAELNRTSQQWKLVAMSDGSYQFINRMTGKALRSNGFNRTARLFTASTTDTRQRWKIVPMEMGGGTYKIVNVSSGNVLENTSGATTSNTYVNENTASTVESTYQAWLFNKEAPFVGLDEVSFGMNLQVWPNPATENLFVQMDGLRSEAQLEVVDLRGSRLMHQVMNGRESVLNIQALSDGIYFLKLTAGQQCKTVKFLVRH